MKEFSTYWEIIPPLGGSEKLFGDPEVTVSSSLTSFVLFHRDKTIINDFHRAMTFFFSL